MARKYRCKFCNHEYSSKRDLRLHMTYHHSEAYFKPLMEKGILWWTLFDDASWRP